MKLGPGWHKNYPNLLHRILSHYDTYWELLAGDKLPHAELGCHVLVRHLVAHSPTHVHHLSIDIDTDNKYDLGRGREKKTFPLALTLCSERLSDHFIHLELDAVALPTVFADARVDKFHQGVPLHQHVRERWTREYPDNLGFVEYKLIKSCFYFWHWNWDGQLTL